MDKDIDVWKQRNEILHKKVNRQMEEIKDLRKHETIFDLARKFPNKTYRELEKYKDADRQEEADRIPLTESQKSQEDLEPIEKGVCVTGTLRKEIAEVNWKSKYNKEYKLRQEVEGELTILKGIETNRVKEAQARSSQLQDELDRVKKDNNDLFLRIAELTEVEESHRKMNGKLQERVTELEEDIARRNEQIEDRINKIRKAGL
tara:strand:+ start:187 stop:798 length:612 start_codon:yes stop_codon:yes gene_type:complete